MQARRWLHVIAFVVALAGWGASAHANIQMSGGGWDAGDTHLGNSAMMARTLTVTGASPESYDNITITAGSGTTLADCTSQFSVAPLTGTVSNVSGGTLNVTFTPGPGKRQANNCVGTFKLAAASIGTFTLAGRGVAPNMVLTTANPLDFGTVRVGNAAVTTSTRNATIQNTGNADLQITGTAIGGDYTYTTTPALPITVTPGTSTTFSLTFDPSASGTQTSTFQAAGRDPAIGSTPLPNIVDNLTGQGSNARIHVSNFNDTSNTVDFGIAPNGVATHATVRVANDAAAPKANLQVASATITPATSGSTWFSFGTNGAFNCAPGSTTCNLPQILLGSSTQIDVVCTPNPPAANETQTATILFASDTDPIGAVSSATLSCAAGRSNVSVSVAQLAFPDTHLGTDSAIQTFSITNTGNINATYAIMKTGANANDFIISNCPTAGSVPPTNGVVTCNVVFHPNTLGAKTASFTISNNDPDPGDSSKVITPVTGTGVQPEISGPALVDFASVDLGSSSTAQVVTITNPGTQALTISSATIVAGPAYAITSGSSGIQSVPPNGGTTSWMIVCTPALQGANAGTFRVLSDAATSSTLNIPMACNGQRGLFSANPPSIDFGGVSQGLLVQRTVMLQNTGNLTITGITGAVMQTAGQGYALDMTSVPATLAPSAIATVKVNFLPPDGNAGGPATVTISGTWTGATAHATSIAIPLNGDGLAEGVDVTPSTLDYGSFRWDSPKTLAFCIVNNSQFAVNIIDVSINPTAGTMTNELVRTGLKRQAICHTGGTAVVGLPLPVGNFLQPSEILEVTITATPMSRVGSLGADVVITTDLAMNPTRHIALTGMSTSGAITFAPSADLELGKTDVDTGPVIQMIAITNTGAADFDLSNCIVAKTDPKIAITLPATQTLAPTASTAITVSYDPDVVEENGATITCALSHILGGPTMATFHIHGLGVDRAIDAPATLALPDTFKHPGSAASVGDLVISNTGEAVLHVTATMISGDAFTLDDGGPVAIAALSSHTFHVRFAPAMTGPFSGVVEIDNDDDAQPMAMIALNGTGIDRNVRFGPSMIDVGVVEVGGTITVADALEVANMDASHAFAIQAITVADSVFTVEGVDAASVPANTTQAFGVTLSPAEAGVFETTAVLFLDEDPDAYGMVTLHGTAVNIDVHGGACSAGGSAAGLAPMLLAIAAVLRRGRTRAIALLVVAAPTIASADISVGAFQPTPATSGASFQLETADVGANGNWVASSVLSFARDLMIIDTIPGGASDHVIEQRFMATIGGAYAFLDRFEAGLSVPLYLQKGDGGDLFESADGGALGDIALHAKVQLVKLSKLAAGAALRVTLPTSTAGQYTGVEIPTVRALGLGRIDATSRISLAAMAGGILRATSSADDSAAISQGSAFAFGGGVTVRALDRLWIDAEVFGELAGSRGMGGNTIAVSPIEGLVGATYRGEHVAIGVAAGRGLSTGIGAPALQAVLSISYTGDSFDPAPLPRTVETFPDRDGDGVGAGDKCPDDKEDLDGFDDTDGCPDDNDGDGIADAADKCPDKPETVNGIDDADGCPDAGPEPENPTKRAGELFDQGRNLVKEARYSEGCAAFEESQRLDPQYGTLYNLAGCYEKMGRLQTAWTMYRVLARSDSNQDRRASSEDVSNAIAPRIPKLKLVLNNVPLSAKVEMNGANAMPLVGVDTPVDLGRYTFTVVAAGYKPWTKIVDVREERKITTVTVDLQK